MLIDRATHDLVIDGRSVAPLVIATTRRARSRGLLGLDGYDGALLLARTRSVHTVGMAFRIDAAACTFDLRVVTTRQLPPWRVLLPRAGVRWILEAEAGAFDAWGVQADVQLGVRPR